MTEWYYADRQHQQQGPVDAAELARLFQAGRIDATTLVWRDGLAQWQPLSGLRGELELDPAPGLDFRTPPVVPPSPPAAHAPVLELEPVAADVAPASGYSPYSAPAAPVGQDPSAPVLGGEVVLAGFWKRVAANLIDSLVVGVAGGIIGMILGMVAVPLAAAGGDDTGLFLLGMQLVIQVVSIGLTAAYYGWFHASNSQATLGKMAIGIKVVRGDGTRISFARGFARYFALMLSALTLGIGFLMAAFTERKQALHDMLCDTLVVDKWAYTDRPEWQRRELGGVTIAVLVIYALILLVIVGAVVALVWTLASLRSSW